jgi:hypothetical protein
MKGKVLKVLSLRWLAAYDGRDGKVCKSVAAGEPESGGGTSRQGVKIFLFIFIIYVY